MPFVIQFVGGSYLKRSVNAQGSKRDRTRTDNIDEATVWSKAGHAKNAFLTAIEQGDLPASTVVHIVEVSYQERSREGTYKRSKEGKCQKL